MKWPFTKPTTKPYLFVWEEQPFAFERGHIYLLQINTNRLSLAEVKGLESFFEEVGVQVKLVAVRTNADWAIEPIKATNRQEIIEQ